MPVSSADDWLDIVDADDRVVGRARRADAHARGLRHRSVHVLLHDTAGRLFVQKRSASKDTNPGLWDTSAAGHVDAGESRPVAARRELAEELGVVVEERALQPLFMLAPQPVTGNEFVSVFQVCSDSPITLEADEIDEGAWLSPDELTGRLQATPERFTEVFRTIIERHRLCPRQRSGSGAQPRRALSEWGTFPECAVLQPNRLRLPVIAAPMFLVSGPEIVIASCKAGIVGSFPALNQRTTDGFAEWLDTIESGLDGVEHPGYGVNLIVHRSNPRLQADLAVCVQHKVPLVITSLGAVSDVVDAVHSYGGQVFHDVINRRHAEKAVEAGVDGLIAVAAGAGGHAGTLSPFAFLNELRSFFDGTLILSGALSSGRDIAAARLAGADYAYLGTRFICTAESRAVDGHKRMIESASSAARDIVYTDAVSGVNANFLTASVEAARERGALGEGGDGSKPELHGIEDEAKAWRDIWSAGQGVGGIDASPSVAELVDGLEAEFRSAIEQLAAHPIRHGG